jgi:hypothetical protein
LIPVIESWVVENAAGDRRNVWVEKAGSVFLETRRTQKSPDFPRGSADDLKIWTQPFQGRPGSETDWTDKNAGINWIAIGKLFVFEKERGAEVFD